MMSVNVIGFIFTKCYSLLDNMTNMVSKTQSLTYSLTFSKTKSAFKTAIKTETPTATTTTTETHLTVEPKSNDKWSLYYLLIGLLSIGGIIIILLVVCVSVFCIYINKKKRMIVKPVSSFQLEQNPVVESSPYEYNEIEDIVVNVNNDRVPDKAAERDRDSYQSIADAIITDHKYLDINEMPGTEADCLKIEEERQNYQPLSRKGMDVENSYLQIVNPKTKSKTNKISLKYLSKENRVWDLNRALCLHRYKEK